MLLNLALSLAGCLVLALVNVASFLSCLGCEARHPGMAIPLWLLIAAGAVLPLLGCACCFYVSLSAEEGPRPAYVPAAPAPAPAVAVAGPRRATTV